jgi:hypothetical protein
MTEKKKEPQHTLALAMQSLEGDKLRVETSLFKGLEPKRGEEVELWAGTQEFPRGEMIGSYMLEADGRKREDVSRPDKAHTHISVVWGPLTVSKPIPLPVKGKVGSEQSWVVRASRVRDSKLHLVLSADCRLEASLPVTIFEIDGLTKVGEGETVEINLGAEDKKTVEVEVPEDLSYLRLIKLDSGERRGVVIRR